MAGGRDLRWRIDAADRTAIVDVANIGNRGRFVVPKQVSSDLTWCSGTALVVLPEFGRVRLGPWEPEGARVERTRSELREAGMGGDQTALDHLVDIENSFLRLTFERGRRLTLPLLVLTHLGLSVGEVFCVRRATDLEIWSPAYRATRLLQRVA
jgi:bifunctional DNA-binding transcriptional regulator/antitoxin component of YhaV-PrlF toxin-antitoxin module